VTRAIISIMASIDNLLNSVGGLRLWAKIRYDIRSQTLIHVSYYLFLLSSIINSVKIGLETFFSIAKEV
jgi:hypothetical protein